MRSAADRFGLIIGLIAGLAGLFIGVTSWLNTAGAGNPREPLASSFVLEKPIVFLATDKARQDYAEAINLLKQIHPDARELSFDAANPQGVIAGFTDPEPQYAIVFICPEELDVNVAWNWLKACTQIDDDPFVDLRTGFITGTSPQKVTDFVARIVSLHHGKIQLAGKFIDHLGGNQMLGKTDFQQIPGNFMVPVYGERLGVESISHGAQGFSKERLNCLQGAGIIHFGGHGYPDQIVDTLNGVYARKLGLSPAVIFNGACYTGVTGNWFDVSTGKLQEKKVKPETAFALGMLENNAVAYLAALHPDHGIPVYQEMEYLAWSGASLGDVIKYTYDGVVIGNGGKMPELPKLVTGMSLNWSPAEIMLRGTAARVLFGDPTVCPLRAFTRPPIKVNISTLADSGLRVELSPENLLLKASFANTFAAELANGNPFNDRAHAKVPLPENLPEISEVLLEKISAGGKEMKGRLVGYAVEQDQGSNFLHLQIDLPANGYLTGDFRRQDANIILTIR